MLPSTPEIFKTTYNRKHNWKVSEKLSPILPYEHYKENILGKDNDIWYVEQHLDKESDDDSTNLVEAKAAVKRMQKLRLWSTYKMHYCKEMVLKNLDEQGSVAEQSFENQLLEYCRKLYGPKYSKILPPVPTSKRVYGYVRPSRMYTPLTSYQNEYGRVGYGVLDK